jgi:L-rhamnono-1,4-lactonase
VNEQLPHVPIQAIIPWAPLDEGREAMQSYHSQLLSLIPSSAHNLIKGFRYLLQDFPSGPNFPMAQDKFIDSLKWMGENDLSFDCTIDTTVHGNKVLENVVDCITKVHQGQQADKLTKFILGMLESCASEPGFA